MGRKKQPGENKHGKAKSKEEIGVEQSERGKRLLKSGLNRILLRHRRRQNSTIFQLEGVDEVRAAPVGIGYGYFVRCVGVAIVAFDLDDSFEFFLGQRILLWRRYD